MKFVASVNSASMHYSRENSQQLQLEKKKKKWKHTEANADVNPNRYLASLFFLVVQILWALQLNLMSTITNIN